MKKGFTLIETLVVIGIIGVIASLTIPAIVANSTKSQYSTALKKAYSSLRSMEQKAREMNGDFNTWSWQGDATDFEINLKPFVMIMKDCGTQPNSGCFAPSYTNLKGDGEPFSDATQGIAKFITMDVMSFGYKALSDEHLKARIYVDVNGLKGPNKYGRDLFVFPLFFRAGIKPDGVFDPSDGITAIDGTVVNEKCISIGEYCSAKVLAEGEMKY